MRHSAPDTIELRALPPPMLGPEGLPAIPGGWTERSLDIGGQRFNLVLPAAPDDFLDDAAIRAAYERTASMPYWTFLWPSALHMAAAIGRRRWIAGTPALELGAGVGLVGLAGCHAGLDVTFTDCDATAVELCLWNARHSGFSRARAEKLDWQSPPAQTYPVIFASDVLYEEQNHPALIALLQRMMTADGFAWFGDGGRAQVEPFCQRLRAAGLSYRLFDEDQQPLLAARSGTYQLIEVRRAGAA